jgi:hypothetical protein
MKFFRVGPDHRYWPVTEIHTGRVVALCPDMQVAQLIERLLAAHETRRTKRKRATREKSTAKETK